jgi:hypothetical protein
MNSYQLKQTARSRRNNAQKVQRLLLNFKASKDKAKDRRKSSSKDQNQEAIYRGDDAGDNEVISDHASGDDIDDMDDTSSDHLLLLLLQVILLLLPVVVSGNKLFYFLCKRGTRLFFYRSPVDSFNCL